jgi:hypothetical protein
VANAAQAVEEEEEVRDGGAVDAGDRAVGRLERSESAMMGGPENYFGLHHTPFPCRALKPAPTWAR